MRPRDYLLRDTLAVDETGYFKATSHNLMRPPVHDLPRLGETDRSDLGVLRSVRALGFKSSKSERYRHESPRVASCLTQIDQLHRQQFCDPPFIFDLSLTAVRACSGLAETTGTQLAVRLAFVAQSLVRAVRCTAPDRHNAETIPHKELGLSQANISHMLTDRQVCNNINIVADLYVTQYGEQIGEKGVSSLVGNRLLPPPHSTHRKRRNEMLVSQQECQNSRKVGGILTLCPCLVQ